MTPTSRQTPVHDSFAAETETLKLGKTALIDLVQQRSTLTRAQSKEAVEAVLDLMIAAARDGTAVGLPGLGTFKVRATTERSGTRPGTNEPITIPAGRKLTFKVAGDLRRDLNAAGVAQ